MQEVHPYELFGDRGYVTLDVQEAKLPNGLVFLLDNDQYEPQGYKYRDKYSARSFWGGALDTALMAAASFGTSIPLRATTDISRGAITAISYGSRAIMGVVQEHTISEVPQWPNERKTAWGILRATSIPGAVNAVLPNQAVHLEEGKQIELFLDPDAVQELFEMSNQTPAQRTVELH